MMTVPTMQTLLAICLCLTISRAFAQEYTFGQATWYEAISNGFCGFGSNIPSNGFVAALPFIEVGSSPNGFWQPPVEDACNDVCFEVSCVPQFVESADGSIFLDRRDACDDLLKAIVVKNVDECRCSLPQFPGQPRGNFQWCCNTPTPRLGINRHIDLSKQAFTALVKDGNFNLGILGIRWRQVSCDNIGVVTLPSVPPMPAGNVTTGVPGQAELPPSLPDGMTVHDMAATTNSPLAEFAQCGGAGGFCSIFGGCADAPFASRVCGTGLACERQSLWYWQCLKDASATPIPTPTPDPAPASTPAPTPNPSPSGKTLGKDSQCGGLGGQCKSIAGSCVDDPFPGFSCGSGLRCVRQNAYYWQCLDATSIENLDNNWSVAQPQPTSQCPEYVADGMQCGGKGGMCATELGACEDREARGVCCEPGLTCTRQNEWYWSCKRE